MTEQPEPNPYDFHRTLATKRMAAGALLFNDAGKLLIVKPSYKPGWEIPGGAVEAEESPAVACRREVREELGIDVELTGLLCVDYNSSTPSYLESLMFLFAVPVLTSAQAAAIVVAEDELTQARFCEPSEAVELLGARLGQRVATVLRHPDRSSYLENHASPW